MNHRRRRPRATIGALFLIAAATGLLGAQDRPATRPGDVTGRHPDVLANANDNRTPSGSLRDGVLTLRLVARPAAWHPEAPDGPRLAVEAFADEGRAPTIPGPLLRAPIGTRVTASIRNALPDTMMVRGLSVGDRNALDSITLAPGQSAEVAMTLSRPGTYVYWGTTLHGGGITRLRGTGGQLIGAIVVDTAGAPPDRVFVISFWDSSPDGTIGERDPFIFVINGRSWPHTERLAYSAGDTVRWRVVNASRDEHPMHLHGFYFRVDARGSWNADTAYASGQRRLAVTETMLPMTTMAVAWAPDRPGNWVFHCHNTAHITGDLHHGLAGTPLPRRPVHLSPGRHAEEGMAGLVMGIEVSGPAPRAATIVRRLRLIAQERFGVYGASSGVGYVLQTGRRDPARDSITIPGPLLLLTAGERAEITVVNRMREPTSVHWHGLELESYYDGVPDWSGTPRLMAPPIAPDDSFRAVLMTPRAGTFIYHAHIEEARQIASGLYGPLIVLRPGQRWNPSRDHVLMLGEGGPDSTARVELNGSTSPPPLELRAGLTHRLRVINITAEALTEVSLHRDHSVTEWRRVAKDGAELPAGQAVMDAARVTMGPGETADFEVTPEPGEWWLEVNAYGEFAFRVPVRVRR